MNQSILLIISFLILFVSSCSDNSLKTPIAEKGVLDLRDWDFKNGTVPLQGEWEFYWQKFLYEKDFSLEYLLDSYMKVPGLWENVSITQDNRKAKGYGTYRLRILMKDTDGYALQLPNIRTAFSLDWNGKEIAKAGEIGIDEKSSKPATRTHILFLTNVQKENTLTLRVSNFHLEKGGIMKNFFLGIQKQIAEDAKYVANQDWLLFGSLFTLAIFQFALFGLRRSSLSPLYFGTFCLMYSFRILTLGETKILMNFLSEEYWTFLSKMNDLVLIISVVFFTAYFKDNFKQEMSNLVYKILIGLNIIFIILTLLTSVFYFSNFRTLYFEFALSSSIFYFYSLFLGIKNKTEGSIFFLVCFLIFILSSLNDFLFYSGDALIRYYTMPFAIFLFSFAQSYFIYRKFFKLFLQVENLTMALSELNYELEQKVIFRTEQLHLSKQKVEDANAELIEKKNQLELLSVTDRLTGLYNRLKLDQVLEDEWNRSQRYSRHFSIVLFDIDKFKSVNDTFGHLTGDQVLIKIANLVSKEIRQMDILGRWGGEEFLIICRETKKDGALILAEKLRKIIADYTFSVVGKMTSSFGVTEVVPVDTISQIMARVDKALYLAKANGRNRIESM